MNIPVIDCTFLINETGLWQCVTCDWIYPLQADDPPRRNCPALADVSPRDALLAQLQKRHNDGARDMALIEKDVERCFSGCRHMLGSVCQRRGTSCRKYQRWIEALLFTGCDLFEQKETENANII